MTHNRNNQIRNKMISQYPTTDREKLVGLRKFIRKHYSQYTVVLEPFMMFSKGEDEYMAWSDRIHYHNNNTIVHPDIILLPNIRWPIPKPDMIIELDGPIHDMKTEKTDKRNKRYELNNIPYIVINESELKLKLAIPKSRKLTQDQINTEFKKRFDKI